MTDFVNKVFGKYRRTILWPISRLVRPNLACRSSNPYSTHIPVLIGISRLFQIRRVLELGCGEYSTLTFLDQEIFPHLIGLDSIENNPDWASKVQNMVGSDARFRIVGVHDAVSLRITDTSLSDYDLVFVDDSQNEFERSATIRAVVKRCTASNIILIHDFEVEGYRNAASSIPRLFTVTAMNPNTGIAWKNRTVNTSSLRQLNSVINRYSTKLSPDNRRAWLDVMTEELEKESS